MGKQVKTKVFKSGNSKAVRLPSSFDIEPGAEVTVREEDGHFVIEPVEQAPKLIDLTGIYGSLPGLKPRTPKEREFDDPPRDWHLLEKPDGE